MFELLSRNVLQNNYFESQGCFGLFVINLFRPRLPRIESHLVVARPPAVERAVLSVATCAAGASMVDGNEIFNEKSLFLDDVLAQTTAP